MHPLIRCLQTSMLALCCACTGVALADLTPVARDNAVPKVALIMGNASYNQPGFSLKNPLNDGELMAKALRKLGFDVRRESNVGRGDMLRTVSDFASKVPAGATAFVYYAGHGMQVGGASYLVPVDMEVTSEQKVPLRAVPLTMVLEALAASRSAVNIVVLDACRNNPFMPSSGVRYPPRHNSCRLLRTKNPGGGDEGNQWHVTDNHSRTGQ